MKIAIAGKGGTGKTTISGTLARSIARHGRPVWAVDADTNPNLASLLGLPPGSADEIASLSRDLLEEMPAEEGCPNQGEPPRMRLKIGTDELLARHGAVGPDGVGLFLAGRVDHAGSG